MRPWNIHVSLIEPGFINSDGFEKVRTTLLSETSREAVSDPYYNHYRFMAGFIDQVMRRVSATPQSVARVALKTIGQRDPALRVPATLGAHLFSLLRRLLPRRLDHALLYRSLPSIRQWGPNARLTPPGVD